MNFSGKSILVVDDEPEICLLLNEGLSSLGATVYEAHDGEEAMYTILRHPEIDLVITDIVMPQQDGIALIRHLRRHHPSIKMIALSGGGYVEASDYLSAARRFGAVRTLEKPLRLAELIDIIHSIYEQPPENRAP